MEDTKIVVTGKPLVDFDCIRNMLGGVVEDAIDRHYTTPAGRLIDPEKAAQAVKDSVDRGAPTREIATASRYLMLAAMSICNDSMNAFEHYLDASEDLPAGKRRIHGAGWAQGCRTDSEHPRRDV